MLLMRISNDIRLPIDELPAQLREHIEADLTLRNPEYDKAVKLGRSTYGKPQFIRLFRYEDGEMVLPRGYGRRLQERLLATGVRFRVDDRRLLLPEVEFGSRIQLRDYQERAVQALVKGRQGGVCAPCGAGKTLILLEAMARIRQPTLWVTHTLDLAEQTIERATQFLDLTKDEIGRIYGGQMTVGHRLTVALVQTLNKVDIDALRFKFGAVIVDEAHHMAAYSFYHPVGQFPALYRLWATATPERADGLTEMVFAGAGPILYTIGPHEVPTITPILHVIETEYSNHDEEYAHLIGDLIKNQRRNELIVRTIAVHAHGHYSLVLSDRVEHLEILLSMLKAALPDLRIEMLTGSMKKADRERVMQLARNRQVDILLATQLAREGLDLPHLDRLFLTTPKRAAGAVQQEVGRIMRPADGKTSALVFDFWDTRSPVLKAQFWKRREVYKKLGMYRQSALRQPLRAARIYR